MEVYRVFIAMGYGQIFEPAITEETATAKGAAERAARRYFGHALVQHMQFLPLQETQTRGRYSITAHTIGADGAYDKAFVFYVERAED